MRERLLSAVGLPNSNSAFQILGTCHRNWPPSACRVEASMCRKPIWRYSGTYPAVCDGFPEQPELCMHVAQRPDTGPELPGDMSSTTCVSPGAVTVLV